MNPLLATMLKSTRQMYPTPLQFKTTVLSLPGSKSISNRALLLAALAQGTSRLEGLLFSDDTEVFLTALTQLQIKYKADRKLNTCIIEGCAGQFPVKRAHIWCHDAGTALRFLLAVCAAMQGEYYFDGSKQLQKRPLTALIECLKEQGANFKFKFAKNSLPFSVQHPQKLTGGNIAVPVSESSQFISGLLMAAPYAGERMIIQSSETKSASYIEMTCKMMQSFGVKVTRPSAIEYCVPQMGYHAQNYKIEPDLSTASYFFAAAALMNGTVTVTNTDLSSQLQGDREFLDVLILMGCEVTHTSNGIRVRGTKKLAGVKVNMRNCADTFMTLACLAPFASTPTTISGIGHARFKECDRLMAVKDNMARLGMRVEFPDDDSMTIFPGTPIAAVLNSYNDHRIVMSFALIGLKIKNITIQNPDCVKKTCPDFFDLWKALYT